ncbi:hypothetical protein DAEQUDRAFT_669479 [Daedalea quercina L-15889]|uniref:Uncharacterized protein n=1 Tax=Daedalea quercina L-15889 TaxID=1314783 RepID=A0A165QKA3_9APHY|nr:hypothetical protein DAEQUDRAFT_669479 [Daedalea quercina L-15889]
MVTLALNATHLPGPYTPLPYLPVSLWTQYEVSRFVLLLTTGALLWDGLSNIYGEYSLLRVQILSWPAATYVVSRFFTAVYVMGSVIWISAPIGHCFAVQKFLDCTAATAVSASSVLFFLRIRAVFSANNTVVFFYLLVLLSVIAGTFTLPFAVTSEEIGPTRYCQDTDFEPYASVAFITPLIHDTLVFFGMSYRLLCNSLCSGTWHTRFQAFYKGQYLPRISAILLKENQKYYVITVGVYIVTVAMFYIRPLPIGYKSMFAVPNVFLANTMACRVFRNTVVAIKKDPQMVIVGTVQGEELHGNILPLTFHRHPLDETDSVIEIDSAVPGEV